MISKVSLGILGQGVLLSLKILLEVRMQVYDYQGNVIFAAFLNCLLSYGARDFPEAQALFPQFYHPLSNVLF
jgi:hypothetical protein